MSGVVAWVASSGVVQGVIIGAAFAFLTTILVLDSVAKAETTTVNGWSSIRKAGQPGNGLLVRAALQKALPLVNVFEEAAYWTTSVDRAGKKLSGEHAYRLHFPSGHLPPNDAFWSLTATDTVGYMVSSPMGRSSVDDHSGLVTRSGWFGRRPPPAAGAERAGTQLAADTDRQIQPDTPRLSAWRGHLERQLRRAAGRQGLVT